MVPSHRGAYCLGEESDTKTTFYNTTYILLEELGRHRKGLSGGVGIGVDNSNISIVKMTF